MSTILSAIAVILAAAALVVAVALPGPAGPAGTAGAPGTRGTNGANGVNGTQGPAGPRGPAGNGTLMAGFVDTSGGGISVCTNASSYATLTVPSKGNVTITASVTVTVVHVWGVEDDIYVFASTPHGACSDAAGYAIIGSTIDNGSFPVTIPVALASSVPSSGTYAYTVASSVWTYPGGAAAPGVANYQLVTGYVVFYPG